MHAARGDQRRNHHPQRRENNDDDAISPKIGPAQMER
jgi:hypothetical protein